MEYKKEWLESEIKMDKMLNHYDFKEKKNKLFPRIVGEFNVNKNDDCGFTFIGDKVNIQQRDVIHEDKIHSIYLDFDEIEEIYKKFKGE